MKNEIPALICKGCVEDLSRAIYLRKLCIKSDLHFTKVISESELNKNEQLNPMKEEYLEEFFIKSEYEDKAYIEEYFIPNQHFDSTAISHIEQLYDSDDNVSKSLIRTVATKMEPMIPMITKAKYQK